VELAELDHGDVGALVGLERADQMARARASRAGTAVGSPLTPLGSRAASWISVNISWSSLEAGPSVPMPVLTPESIRRL
jgi:hypothetical protein